MSGILVTSSVLILALLLLRWLFRDVISCRIRYTLWALVLIRLLVPVTLPALDFSVLTVTGSADDAVSQRLESVAVFYRPVAQMETSMSAPQAPDAGTPVWTVRDSGSDSAPEFERVEGYSVLSEDSSQYVWYAKEISLQRLLTYLWWTGMAGMACWLVSSNVRFGRMLKKARTVYPVPGCRYPVYLVEQGLCSPCLFGFWKPAIYLTPAAVKDEETLRHVITHEITHGAHLDLLWSFLRGVCLVVYWFDPLVWIAARASRIDCELACDEGAIKRLGEEERLAYGQTLLSLIPIRRSRDPLLSATTMTSDKRRLKDRILRIAENRKTVVAALAVVLLAVAVTCILTFTGAEKEETPALENPSRMEGTEQTSPEEKGEPASSPLTGEELAWFNQVFFGVVVDQNGALCVNIRCQFLTSSYANPAQIDLFELLYNGLGTGESLLSPEEMELVGSEVCPTDKLPVEAINGLLLTYTGLTLEETEQVGLDRFPYLEAYDSYYHTHGDTNWPGSSPIQYGSRNGDRIALYHRLMAGASESGWMCLTLQDKGDGNYWFVSNLSCDAPRIQMALPEGEPALAVPLSSQTPIQETLIEIERASDDRVARGGGYQIADRTVRSYLSEDGNIYAAIVYEEALNEQGLVQWEAGRFFTYPADMELSACRIVAYESLFGFPTVVVQYPGQYPNGTYGSCCNLYGLDSGTGDLYFLTTVYGDWPQQMDLNGDGADELVAAGGPSAQILYRDGDRIYQVDVGALLEDAWPELQSWNYAYWDENRRALLCGCTVAMPQWGENAFSDCVREIYFDGEKLLVYPQQYGTVDHLSEAVPMDAYPECVYEAAKNLAQTAYQKAKNNGEGMMQDQDFDDWRVTALRFVHLFQEYDLLVEVYETDYAFHASDPGSVVLAGGTSIDEDGWVGGFYRDQSPYLLFQVDGDGNRIRLESCIPLLTSPGSIAYDGYLYASLLQNGLLQPAALTGEHQLAMLLGLRNSYLNLLGEFDPAQWQGAAQSLAQYCQAPDHEEQMEDLRETLDWLTPDAWTEEGRAVYSYLQGLLGD